MSCVVVQPHMLKQRAAGLLLPNESSKLKSMNSLFSLGLDYGTESVRAILVRIADGMVAGQAAAAYEHGVIDRQLPSSGEMLPPDYALQHPRDWLDSAGAAYVNKRCTVTE